MIYLGVWNKLEELIVLIFLILLMFYSLFRLFFCFIKVFQKKEIKKFLLIMANLFNILEFSLKTFMLLEKTGVI